MSSNGQLDFFEYKNKLRNMNGGYPVENVIASQMISFASKE